jgi:hypothetical protein
MMMMMIFRVGVCSRSYPACTARALYYTYVVWLYRILLHNLITGTTFGGKKMLLNIKCVLIGLQLCLKHFSF